MENLPRLTPAGKKALVKYGAILLFIILGFSLLSRVLTHNGQTLAQYGEANPSIQGNLSVSDSDAASAGGNSDNAGVSGDGANLPANSAGTAGDGANLPANSAGTAGNGTNLPANSAGTAGSGTDMPTDSTGADKDNTEDNAAGGIQDESVPKNDDTAWQVSEDGLTANGGTESPERVTYKPNFYYEPLSENLIGYITGSSYPDDDSAEISLSELNYVHILHYNFEGEISEGELICNSAIAQDLVEIFYELYTAEYQLERVLLIDYYDADDTTSMMANNTSCFNYRNIDDTDKLSRHAFGLAIDVNPFYNPYIRFTKDGGQIISPESSEAYADRTQSFPYKIDADDLCCRLFLEHGFTWGGNWNSSKDYQHFQKIID